MGILRDHTGAIGCIGLKHPYITPQSYKTFFLLFFTYIISPSITVFTSSKCVLELKECRFGILSYGLMVEVTISMKHMHHWLEMG